MVKWLLIVTAFLVWGNGISAQRKGADTLTGYIVSPARDTLVGRIVIPFTITRAKGKDKKEYKQEDWFDEVSFIDTTGKLTSYGPAEINGYAFEFPGEKKNLFRSFDITIPNKGLLLAKGKGRQFLLLEIEGKMSLYWYYHREDALGVTAWINDCYLLNEKGEMQVLKLKKASWKYRLSEIENWFAGYPGLSKYDLKGLYNFEVAGLVAGYNTWKGP